MHKYIEICRLFEKLESLQSRNDMSSELAQFLRKCDSEEIQIISYMIQGRVAPMFVTSEFNYSEKSLVNLLSNQYYLDVGTLRMESGDIGDTVFQILSKDLKEGEFYTLVDIYEILWDMVNISGIGAVLRKDKIVLETLKKLSPIEGKYFVRTICGELRLGLSVRSLLDSFSIYINEDKSLKPQLEHAYGVCADIGYIGKKVSGLTQENATEILSNISAQPGTPILSRLVQRVGSFQELLERFKETLILQPKFDGLRCQIHKWEEKVGVEDSEVSVVWKRYKKDSTKESQNLFEIDNFSKIQVKLFTRNLEDVTEMFPDIVDSAKKIENESFILDSEIVGWDYKKRKFLSYQETMQRRRKYSVQSKSEDVPVRAFVFDLMYLDSKSLVIVDTKERIGLLNDTLKRTQEGIVLAETKTFSEQEDIKRYFEKCVEDGLEGIIVKQEKGGYKPGARNYEWIKIKKSIDKDLVDTIDMVIVGYYKGSGRRTSLGVGAILGAIYNQEDETYDAICKIGTGMSDEILRSMSEKLGDIALEKSDNFVRVVDNLTPDVWVLPKYVITVDADEITRNISGVNKSVGEGLSLRFPRLIEFDRDKAVEDITTVQELVDMYNMRKGL